MLIVSRAFVAVRILQYIAKCPDKVAKKNEIADAISAPTPYTGKIVRELLLAGFIKSLRGAQGGYTLALPAASIRVGEVVQLVDDTRSWRTGTSSDNIAVHDALKEAQDRFFDVLNKHSIADLSSAIAHHDRRNRSTGIKSKRIAKRGQFFNQSASTETEPSEALNAPLPLNGSMQLTPQSSKKDFWMRRPFRSE